MNETPPLLERIQAYAAGFEGAWPDNPWDHLDPVYKLANQRIFVFTGRTEDGGATVTVKLGKEAAEEAKLLPFVVTAPYIGRHGWVMATVRNEAELDIVLPWIKRSYELVAPQPKSRPRTRG
ncbi:MAG: MmcQ/YjbR family DNA-binding protein [Dehalococcoidia bacterium]